MQHGAQLQPYGIVRPPVDSQLHHGILVGRFVGDDEPGERVACALDADNPPISAKRANDPVPRSIEVHRQ